MNQTAHPAQKRSKILCSKPIHSVNAAGEGVRIQLKQCGTPDGSITYFIQVNTLKRATNKTSESMCFQLSDTKKLRLYLNNICDNGDTVNQLMEWVDVATFAQLVEV